MMGGFVSSGSMFDGQAGLPQVLITVALIGAVVYALMMMLMKKTGAEDQRHDARQSREALERLESKADRIIELLESIERSGGGSNESGPPDDQS